MMRKSGSGRANEVAFPYVQTAFRSTARAGSGILGIRSIGSRGTLRLDRAQVQEERQPLPAPRAWVAHRLGKSGLAHALDQEPGVRERVGVRLKRAVDARE